MEDVRRVLSTTAQILHKGTNIAQRYQILQSAVCLQVAHAEGSLTEMGGSCEYNKETVVDSRERVVFILVSCMTLYQLLILTNVYRLLYFTQKLGLGDTKGCGLNLSDPISGQLPVFGEQKYSLDSIKQGGLIDLQKKLCETICVEWSHSVNNA